MRNHRNNNNNNSGGGILRGLSFLHLLSCLFGGCIATFCLNIFHGTFIAHDVEHFHDVHLNPNNAAALLSLRERKEAAAALALAVAVDNKANEKKKPQKVEEERSVVAAAAAAAVHVPINLPDQPAAVAVTAGAAAPGDHHHHHPQHPIAGLDCSAHGGPNHPEPSQELVYWKDLPLDSQFTSPFRDPNVRRYLTFEPDGGGWNNIRMSMETVLGMAIATGRVLVLPPSQKMYLLGKDSFSFADFFPLHDIAQEHDGLEIISMKQFLEETYGKLRKRKDGSIANIPNNVTEWDGDTNNVKALLNPFLQSIAELPDWDPVKCMAAFPKSKDPKDIELLRQMHKDLIDNVNPKIEDFVNQPTPVNASAKDRMAEFLAGRKEICIYDETLQTAPIIHFHGKKTLGARLLVHFYAFLYFQDYHEDLWMKRFVRDHVRYIDDVQCAAARVVEAVREHSRQKNKENGRGGDTDTIGIYDSFHIRRGDFQYKKTRIPASEILEQSKNEIPPGTTVYVGTDERHKEFFNDFKGYGWDVLFLDDFMHLLEGVNKNYYGMIDQLIASKGRTFFGCWFSTFTGYITRLRGYHSQNLEAEGYDMGLLPHTYYYALKEHKTKMHDYWPIKQAFYPREFPASWRNLDFDLDLDGDEARH